MNRRKLARRTALARQIRIRWLLMKDPQDLADPVFFVEKIIGKPLELWQRRSLRLLTAETVIR